MRAVLRTVKALVALAQLLIVAVSLYQTVITLVGRRRQPPRSPIPGRPPRFALIVCARNEEAVVGGILDDLAAQTYPADLVDIVLVAHNCTDDTASTGRDRGVRVIEADTPGEGKAAAMQAGLAAVTADIDFAGVFDADSRVPPDLLERVVAGAGAEACIQVETVPHRTDDWLATGYGLGRRARNVFWWRPREALGLGTTFTGTGYFVRPALLHELLAGVHTLTEDLELTARLYARGGRVAYLSSTHVRVEEPHSFGVSLRQRLRWVRGHFAVLRHYLGGLTGEAARRDARALDMALYMLLPSRVLTRSGVTLAFGLSVLRAPGRLPAPLTGLALAGEWAVPVAIAVRERLVPLSLGGLEAAVRHGLLNLLWFPIGLWALVTPGARAWDAVPRARREERDATRVR